MKYLFFILFVFNYIFLSSQNNDTVKLAAKFLKKSLSHKNTDSIYKYASKSYQLLKNTNSDSLKFRAAIRIILTTDSINEQNYLYKLYKENFEKENKLNSLLELHFTKAKNHFFNKNYSLSLPILLKIDSIANTNNIINKITINSLITRSQISKQSFTQKAINDAIIISEEALKKAKKINNEALINRSYLMLSELYYMNNEISKATKYLKITEKYYRKTNKPKLMARVFLLYKNYYQYDKKDLKKTDSVLVEAINYFTKKHYYNEDLADLYVFYGNFIIKTKKNYKKALYNYLKADSIYYNNKKSANLHYVYLLEGISESYKNLNNYKKAYQYNKHAYDIRKKLYKKQSIKTSRELETKYQNDKKEKEIALLKSQTKLTEQQKKNQQILLLSGLGLTTIAGLFFFFQYQNRKKINNKLKELDKAKSNFFTNISHEFRTPLTLILGTIQKQLKEQGLNTEKQNDLKIMQRNSNRLLSLVDQLLDISKIETGNLKVQVSKNKILPFISTLVEGFNFIANQKQITFNTNISSENTDTWFDKDAIEKIVINLLSNAVKYTPKKGKIKCTAFLKDNYLHLEVKNTGKILSKKELKKIFIRFYQTDENRQGVGIGLSLIKELVKLYKGTISVKSTTKWTSFNIKLPISKSSFNENEIFTDDNKITKNKFEYKENIPENNIKKTKKIINTETPILLIVEDNKDVRTYINSIFKEDYTILQAKNGQEGIDMAFKYIPDFIISDIMMPVKNGIELCNQLKNDERTSHIPIILLTAKAGEKNEIEGIKTGADDYITKPFNNDLLKLKVNNLFKIRKKIQEYYAKETVLIPKDININSIDETFLERVKIVLNDNLIESSFDIKEFSKAVGMSRMQLHRKLKALTGLSASEFIRSQRLKLAAQLLKKSDANVSQIGYSVGFNNPGYFSKCFKEMYGCTPSEYVKNNS